MLKEVNVNGRVLPCHYGNAALAQFLESEGMKLSDLEKFGQDGISLKTALSLVYFGIKDGHRKMKKEFPYTWEDVADLVDDDPTLIQQCADVFTSSMPQAKEGEGNGQAPVAKKAPAKSV